MRQTAQSGIARQNGQSKTRVWVYLPAQIIRRLKQIAVCEKRDFSATVEIGMESFIRDYARQQYDRQQVHHPATSERKAGVPA